MNDSTRVAAAAIAALRRGGVADVVLAPGSRSAALAIALHQADVDGLLRLHVRIDERTAGFLALGLAKGSHRPVAVVTTSGTAVANLHPAVLEASHVGERLIVLSADRPASLRGTGANQTTDQAGIFGPQVPCADLAPGDGSAAANAIADATSHRGPSQINLQFADPLLPDELPLKLSHDDLPPPDSHQRPQFGRPGDAEHLPLGPRTVVVAGDDAGPPARLLAQRAGWPLLAEPTSGSRTGTHAIRTYRLLLGGELGQQIERVIVAGHPTLSRPVTRLISRADLDVISVRGTGGIATDPGRVARHLDVMPTADEAGASDQGWIDQWRKADRQLSARVDALAAKPHAAPLAVAGAVADAIGPGGLLVVGSSQPVRDLDVMMTPYPAGQRRLIVGNRGLAGIDGTVSTAVGAALGRADSSRAIAYVGDVTFLHDLTGLVIGPDEPQPDLTIVVANDDGGAIFTTLEQGDARFAASFERVFGTPHGVSIESWCGATKTQYSKTIDIDQLGHILVRPQRGLHVVEVPINREHRRDLDSQLRALV